MDKCLPSRFHALGDPTRLGVVERLMRGPASVSELAAPYAMALPPFTKHLAVLERAGLVRSMKSGRVRTYRINPEGINDLDLWFKDRRALWHARLTAIDTYLTEQVENP